MSASRTLSLAHVADVVLVRESEVGFSKIGAPPGVWAARREYMAYVSSTVGRVNDGYGDEVVWFSRSLSFLVACALFCKLGVARVVLTAGSGDGDGARRRFKMDAIIAWHWAVARKESAPNLAVEPGAICTFVWPRRVT